MGQEIELQKQIKGMRIHRVAIVGLRQKRERERENKKKKKQFGLM
jgi:hypothetical protein